MASSRADWDLGEARLISSARTMLAKTGPGWNSKALAVFWKMETPTMSEGMMSEVNWMRLKRQSMARERA